jgi:hypothetical protein
MIMLILAVALAVQPVYQTKIPPQVTELQALCRRFEAAKSEGARQSLAVAIKPRLKRYSGDRDMLLLRCQRRVQVR